MSIDVKLSRPTFHISIIPLIELLDSDDGVESLNASNSIINVLKTPLNSL